MRQTLTIETVTPTMAREWLKNTQSGQRSVRQDHVIRLTKEILSGNWRMSWDNITLINGKLGNGQHRCLAIVAANKSVQCGVLRTNDVEIFETGDNGISREVRDVLARYGFSYTNPTAGAARIILSYNCGLFTPRGIGNKKITDTGVEIITKSDIVNYAKKNKEKLSEASHFIGPYYDKNKMFSMSYAIALYILCSERSGCVKSVRDFLQELYTGEGSSAAFDMRERLIKNKLAKAKYPPAYIFGLVIKSYNLFCKNTRTNTMKFSENEIFPKIA